MGFCLKILCEFGLSSFGVRAFICFLVGALLGGVVALWPWGRYVWLCSPVWSRFFLTPRHEFCLPLLWVLSSVWSRCCGPLRQVCFAVHFLVKSVLLTSRHEINFAVLFSFGEAGVLGLQARVVFFPWCGRPHFVGPVFLGLWTNLFLAVHSFGKIVVSDSWGPVGVDAAVGLWKFYTNFAVSIVGRL